MERTFWTWRTIRAADLREGDIIRSADGVGDVVASVTPSESDPRSLRIEFKDRTRFQLARTYEAAVSHQLFAIQVEDK